MIEIWKPIRGYEGYEVSNLGRIKSLNYNHTGCEKILKPVNDGKGYLKVFLFKNGKRKNFQIHRLVAQTFIPNPDNKPCVNHIDCNPSNNCINNLEWCTYKENTQYALELGRMKCIENGKKRSKPLIAINLTTGEKLVFNSQIEASRQLNLSDSNINKVLKGKLKRTGNYTFKYAEED